MGLAQMVRHLSYLRILIPLSPAMSSTAAKERWARYYRITLNLTPALFPCDYCKAHHKDCVFIADFSLMPCAECARRGRTCVSSSLASLDRAEDDLVAKISADKDKIDRLLSKLVAAKARLERNEKVLEAASKRTQKKLACLLRANPLEAPDGVTVEDALFDESVFQEMQVQSPFVWNAAGGTVEPGPSS